MSDTPYMSPEHGVRIRRRRPTPRRASRVRDTDYMLWVKTLDCAAHGMSPCGGVIEADHGGRRGLGQKSDDTTTYPLCTTHHRERTDFSGPFKRWSQADMRGWIAAAIEHTQALWRAQGRAA